MRPCVVLTGLLFMIAPTVLGQLDGAPDLSTVSQPDGATATTATDNTAQTTDASGTSAARTTQATTAATDTTQSDTSETTQAATTADATTKTTGTAGSTSAFNLAGAPTLAGVGVPVMKVPDTAGASFMQKSDLPDGTVFICVGAILAFFGCAVLAWRGLVAWSLHRSVKRAAMAQNLADIKAMSAVPGKKRGMYNVVNANSTMSLDHLNAAPIGKSKSTKPFAAPPGNSPQQRSTSQLFFSPTAGGAAGMRDSMVNRSSTYLPAGYYAAGNAAPASGSPQLHVGGQNPNNLSALSLSTPGNRFSSRSGVSPPESPSLPPSRGGYPRAPPSRDGLSAYNRNSVATMNSPGNTRSGIYSDNGSMSQLSLPGGTNVAGGRAPSAYLEDLFENHGAGPRERF